MKRYFIWGICLILFSYLLLGCGEKQETLEQMQEPLSIEVAPVATTPLPEEQLTPVPLEVPSKAQETQIPLPPQGPYKPTHKEIQTALKNAGYYSAEIDGKIGPQTLKAIKEFQADNNLEVDAKVGPKTWSVLSKHLNPPAPAPVETKKKR